jgi:hypothetical protein
LPVVVDYADIERYLLELAEGEIWVRLREQVALALKLFLPYE